MKADKEKASRLIKTARGQLDGILKMIEDDRYCVDIAQQLMATQAILKKVNMDVLSAHLKSCVANAETESEKNERVDELMTLLGRTL